MKQNKGIQLAYLAGVIDSDGCIAIKKTTKNGKEGGISPSYSLQVLVNTPDGRIPDYLYGVFGGAVYKVKQYGDDSVDRMSVFRWEIIGIKAGKLCKKMIPFLRLKKKQAELGYRFMEMFKRQSTGRKGNGYYRVGRLTDRELEERESLYRELRDLKQIFVPSAVVETKRSDSSKDEKR